MLGSSQLENIFKVIKSRCPTISRCHLRAGEQSRTCGMFFSHQSPDSWSRTSCLSPLGTPCYLFLLTFPAQFCFGNLKLEHLFLDTKLSVALPRSLPRWCSGVPHLQATPRGFRECLEDWICLWNGFNQTIFSCHFLDPLQLSVTALNQVHKNGLTSQK